MNRVMLAALVVLGACSSVEDTRIDDTWLARVPSDRLGEVNDARAAETAARDEVVRAQVRQGDAERYIAVARAKADAAAAEVKAAQAGVEAASATGQASQIQARQRALTQAEANFDAAQSEVAYRSAVAEQWTATVDYRQRVVEAAEARTALHKFHAVQRIGDVRAQRLEEANFTAAVQRADDEVAKARAQVDRAAERAQQLRPRAAGPLPQS